ncbi:tRNA (guanine(46)-N(7))-methyltransferase TrmB [Atopobium deltae]|uniref:tRNA (guanine(46)-N(7))-methyltransferase n=1 Tax=Atopobium deltae TaxID=1393034 RepID=A0A133XPX0_9ACTN|nr:methyltransferase domain-containing protein [Atopobium deltae]KXB32991.1 putative tRNA (guanine-N(7)-)-methyltransferase [Atopobium deltae]
MHALHARLPKNFVLEERLERFGHVIEVEPTRLRGQWVTLCYPSMGADSGATSDLSKTRFSKVYLDLGCGKGVFTCELAAQNPDALCIGMDSEPLCIAYAAQRAHEAHLNNVIIVPGNASKLASYFAEGELERIYLNFPTPFPRKKEATARLTHALMLASYTRLLAHTSTSSIRFKTDSIPLYRFSLTQIEPAGYELCWKSEEVRDVLPDEPQTGYEKRLRAKGAQIHGFEIVPRDLQKTCPTPEAITPKAIQEKLTMSMSLVDYLPDDLSELSYIPHGMEGTVVNLRNRRLRKAMAKNC